MWEVYNQFLQNSNWKCVFALLKLSNCFRLFLSLCFGSLFIFLWSFLLTLLWDVTGASWSIRWTLQNSNQIVIFSSILLPELLRETSDLTSISCANVLLDLIPVFAILRYGFNEQFFFIDAPRATSHLAWWLLFHWLLNSGSLCHFFLYFLRLLWLRFLNSLFLRGRFLKWEIDLLQSTWWSTKV